MRLPATIIIAAALVLAGCPGPGVERVVPTGEAGAVPYGWQAYCAREPADPSCPRREP